MEHHGPRPELDVVRTVHEPDDAAVGNLDPLRLAGRAGGVDDVGKVIGRRRRKAARIGRTASRSSCAAMPTGTRGRSVPSVSAPRQPRRRRESRRSGPGGAGDPTAGRPRRPIRTPSWATMEPAPRPSRTPTRSPRPTPRSRRNRRPFRPAGQLGVGQLEPPSRRRPLPDPRRRVEPAAATSATVVASRSKETMRQRSIATRSSLPTRSSSDSRTSGRATNCSSRRTWWPASRSAPASLEQVGVLPDELESAASVGTPTTLRSAFAVPFGTPWSKRTVQPAPRSAPRGAS